MKNLRYYHLFESSIGKPTVTIEDFLQRVGLGRDPKFSRIVEWWKANRSDFKINYFTFSSPQPIAGVYLGTNEIAINERLPMPPHVKLFLALHESRHCDQEAQGIIQPGYYDTVVRGDINSFLQSYRELERDANDFAIRCMTEMGFDMRFEEPRLRANEGAGQMVYAMMTNDIARFRPIDFIDLLKKQIL